MSRCTFQLIFLCLACLLHPSSPQPCDIATWLCLFMFVVDLPSAVEDVCSSGDQGVGIPGSLCGQSVGDPGTHHLPTGGSH